MRPARYTDLPVSMRVHEELAYYREHEEDYPPLEALYRAEAAKRRGDIYPSLRVRRWLLAHRDERDEGEGLFPRSPEIRKVVQRVSWHEVDITRTVSVVTPEGHVVWLEDGPDRVWVAYA